MAVAVAGRPNSRVTCAGACRPAATCPPRCRVEAPPAPLAAGRAGTLRAWRADRFGNRITEARLCCEPATEGRVRARALPCDHGCSPAGGHVGDLRLAGVPHCESGPCALAMNPLNAGTAHCGRCASLAAIRAQRLRVEVGT